MALGLTKSSGDDSFLPILKLNSVSGDVTISSSVKNAAGDWEKQEKDVKLPAKLIFDFENLEVGWMHFGSQGPTFALVKLGQPMPTKPADHDPDKKKYNQGFRIRVYSKEYGLAVLSQSSKTVGEVMDILHDQYLTGAKANPGKVAVVEFKGTKKVSVKTKEGAKNYKQPDWSIVSWVARPEAMNAKVETPEPAAEVSDDTDF